MSKNSLRQTLNIHLYLTVVSQISIHTIRTVLWSTHKYFLKIRGDTTSSYFYLYLVLLRDHYDEQCFDVVGHVTGDGQANIYAMSIHGGCTEWLNYRHIEFADKDPLSHMQCERF